MDRYKGKVKAHVRRLLIKHKCHHFIDDHLDNIVWFIFAELFKNLKNYDFSDFDRWFSFLRFSKTMKYIGDELKFTTKEKTIFEREISGEDSSRVSTWGESQPSQDPDSEQRLLIEQLKSKVADMPEASSCPLILHYFGGYSYKEISEILSININSVGPKISRALSKLSDELA